MLQAGVPAFMVGSQCTTDFNFSLLPQFPASSKCNNVLVEPARVADEKTVHNLLLGGLV